MPRSISGLPGVYNLAAITLDDGDGSALAVNANGELLVNLEAADIQIGSVELKDADSTALANIKAANTARTTATVVVATQPVDAAGAVLSTSALATSAKQLAAGHSVVVDASATVGATPFFDADADNVKAALKAAPGAIYGIEVSNPNSADAYLQLFDLAIGSITVGTTTPNLSFLVPAGDGTKDGAMDKSFTVPIKFSTEINYACTVEVTGSTDPTIGLVVNILYQ